MAIALVQITNNDNTSLANSLQTPAFSSANVAGNTILVGVQGYISATPTTITVTDTQGNTYACDLLNAYNAGSSDIISNPGTNNVPAGVPFVGTFRASGIAGGSSNKVTVALGGSVTGYLAIEAAEFSGVSNSSPVDVTSNNAGASGNPSVGSFTTGYPTDLLFISFGGIGGSSPTVSIPSGFSNIAGNNASSFDADGNSSYELVSAVQSSIDPTWTVTNFTDWVSVAVAYKADLIVQSTSSASGSGVTSVTTTAFGSSVTAGDTVIVTVTGQMGSTAATLTPSDSKGNTYTWDSFYYYNSGVATQITNPSSTTVPASKYFVGVARSSNIGTGGSSFTNTMTVGSSNTASMIIGAGEFTGLGTSPTIDTTADAVTASGSTAGPGSYSTTNAHDLLVQAVIGSGASGATAPTAPTGFTNLMSHGSGLGYAGAGAYETVQSTQSSINPLFGVGSHTTNMVAIAVAYEAQAASVPSAPTGLSAAAGTPPDQAVDLSWTNPSGSLTDNHIYYGTTNVFSAATKFDLGAVVVNENFGGLQPGTTYYFWVTASNSVGESSPDGPVSWTTQQDTPFPIGATQGLAGFPYGYTNANRRNRVEGVRYRYVNQ
jgi:Fibronectin type III domain